MRLLATMVAVMVSAITPAEAGEALKRLTPERLDAVTKAVAELRAQRKDLQRLAPFKDYRANLHVHSQFSHDSRGQIEDIVAAAKKVGTQVLMFSEHPADHYDFFIDGHRGIKDGVLLIPGAEMRGFLCYPTQSLKGLDGGSNQEFTDLVCGRNGRLFLCHLEERMDWTLSGITGTEIYNTHADFKEETELLNALKNPLWLFRSADLFRKYPPAAFAAFQDYPADYLRRYDELCQLAPHTGVAGNDAHQNVGLRLRLGDNGKVKIMDALDKPVLELVAKGNPLLEPLAEGKQPGDVLFEAVIDRYETSLGYVGTHLLMPELSEKAVWDALGNGRAYVAFDWLCDATGFDFAAVKGNERFEIGSKVSLGDGLAFRGQTPLSGHWRLIRNGQVAKEITGDTLAAPITEGGVYRVEVSLDVAGEPMTWILSNPIYVTPKSNTSSLTP